MRFFALLLAVLLSGGTAYLFWPRSPGFQSCDPVSAARNRAEALRAASSGRFLTSAFSEYRFLAVDLDYPPLRAAEMAWNRARALGILLQARDAAEEEEALPLLSASVADLAPTADAVDAIARLELVTFQLSRSPSGRKDLETAISEQLAILHGGSAAAWRHPASLLADAALAAQSQDWSRLEPLLARAFSRIREQKGATPPTDVPPRR